MESGFKNVSSRIFKYSGQIINKPNVTPSNQVSWFGSAGVQLVCFELRLRWVCDGCGTGALRLHTFNLLNSLRTGRKQLQHHCCASSIKTIQWLVYAATRWAFTNATSPPLSWLWTETDMGGMQKSSVFHQESLLLQQLIGMNQKARAFCFFLLLQAALV